MPKVLLGTDKRETALRESMSAGMARQGIRSKKELAGSMYMARQTLYDRWKNPRKFTLGDLWSLADKLKLTDEEILRIFKR